MKLWPITSLLRYRAFSLLSGILPCFINIGYHHHHHHHHRKTAKGFKILHIKTTAELRPRIGRPNIKLTNQCYFVSELRPHHNSDKFGPKAGVDRGPDSKAPV